MHAMDLTDASGISKEVRREWHATRRGGRKVRGKKVRVHSQVRLPLVIETLLPVHNIS